MKKQKFFSLVFSTALILSVAVSASAQISNTWKGGTPGHETDWSYFKNWSLGKTPDVFDNVVIPDVSTTTRCYPVIATGEIEVLSLEVQTGASLTLKKSAFVLTETFVCQGICKGCSSRILIENTESQASRY
jgi:hypothetical protein